MAYADLLAEAGRPTLVVLDDVLAQSESECLAQMKHGLFDALSTGRLGLRYAQDMLRENIVNIRAVQHHQKGIIATVRIRPGGLLVIRPPLLRALGGDPARLTLEQDGNRLFLSRRQSPQEARVARLKARLTNRRRAAP